MKPGGQRQVKEPMVLAQKNRQLCCLEEHSSRSAAQTVPAGSGQGAPGLGTSQGKDPRAGVQRHAVAGRGRAAGDAPWASLGDQGQRPTGPGGDVTSAGPAVLLQQVASGTGAQEAALGVFAEGGTRCGGLATLVHI